MPTLASLTCWKILTLVGLALNLVGVILLFRYVLPRRQRTGGVSINFHGDVPNKELIKLERRWDFLSLVGLTCVIVGIAFQAVGVFSAP